MLALFCQSQASILLKSASKGKFSDQISPPPPFSWKGTPGATKLREMAVESPHNTLSTDVDDESYALRMRDHADHDAFAMLVHRHGVAVVAYCRSRLARACEAEDVAQDVWTKVWARRAQFALQGERSFRRWLLTIARTTCIDAGRKKLPDFIDEEHAKDAGAISYETPDWLAALAQRRQALEACIAELPPRQQCIVQATLTGQKTAGAAEQCDCTPAQASTAKYQAIASLRHCTESKGV